MELDTGYKRLEDQINWYDTKSRDAQWWYKHTKLAEIFFAAMIPFVATVSPQVTALLGGSVIVIEALQHLSQWSNNWITYRSTCEALRHEKYFYLGKANVYEGKTDEDAKRILVSRVEALISTEHSKWISRQEYESKKPKVSPTVE